MQKLSLVGTQPHLIIGSVHGSTVAELNAYRRDSTSGKVSNNVCRLVLFRNLLDPVLHELGVILVSIHHLLLLLPLLVLRGNETQFGASEPQGQA